jgi:hypothetical protein
LIREGPFMLAPSVPASIEGTIKGFSVNLVALNPSGTGVGLGVAVGAGERVGLGVAVGVALGSIVGVGVGLARFLTLSAGPVPVGGVELKESTILSSLVPSFLSHTLRVCCPADATFMVTGALLVSLLFHTQEP